MTTRRTSPDPEGDVLLIVSLPPLSRARIGSASVLPPIAVADDPQTLSAARDNRKRFNASIPGKGTLEPPREAGASLPVATAYTGPAGGLRAYSKAGTTSSARLGGRRRGQSRLRHLSTYSRTRIRASTDARQATHPDTWERDENPHRNFRGARCDDRPCGRMRRGWRRRRRYRRGDDGNAIGVCDDAREVRARLQPPRALRGRHVRRLHGQVAPERSTHASERRQR